MGVLLFPRLYNCSFISLKRDCLILCTNNIDFPFCNSFLIAFYFPYAFLYTINELGTKKPRYIQINIEYIKAFSIKYYSHSSFYNCSLHSKVFKIQSFSLRHAGKFVPFKCVLGLFYPSQSQFQHYQIESNLQNSYSIRFLTNFNYSYYKFLL